MINSKSAVVTGVSSGIGRAIAEALMEAGWHVFGSVRSQKDATTVTEALGEGFTPLLFDVTDRSAIDQAAKTVKSALNGQKLAGLINNAGIAVAGPIAYLPEKDLQRQLNVNVFGPMRVTQAFLPLLGTDTSMTGESGRIINMSSVAGKIASPFMAPYAMSKHALEAMTDSLRRELIIHGIDVIAIGPGAVKTPIWAKADDIDINQYRNTEYFDTLERMKTMMQTFGNEGLEPEEVASLTLIALTKENPKTRYAAIKSKLMNWTIPRLLPARMVDNAIAKRFNLKGPTA